MMHSIPHPFVTASRTTLPVQLTDNKAIKCYENALKDTMIYRYAEDYFLGGIIQPPVANVLTKAHPLKHSHFPHEDEPCCVRLGKLITLS